MNIAVYCGSVSGNDPIYEEAARELGTRLAQRGHTLVFGCSDTGLMGAVANAAMAHGAKVIGVIPNVTLIHERKHPGISEYHYTETMSERKDKMIALSDAFIALPGGYGTLDEISDILCLNRIGVMRKPSVFVNAGEFYDPLKRFFSQITKSGFAGSDEMDTVLFSDKTDEILDFIEQFAR